MVSTVSLYILKKDTPEAFLPKWLEKTLEKRVWVWSASSERLEAWDTLLWTFRSDSFVAHGREGVGRFPEWTPVWLSNRLPEASDARTVLIILEPCPNWRQASVEKTVGFFETHDPFAKTLLADAQPLTYSATAFHQTVSGQWA